MTMRSDLLASGPGWWVHDIVCTAGPKDRPFTEQHDSICIAAVTGGTFQYRTSHGSAVLAAGAVLLGNDRACFECGHEHAVGDRCLSFHFTPDLLEMMVAAVCGARSTTFAVPSLPPLAALAPLLAEAEVARDARNTPALEEIAVRLAGAVTTLLAEARQPSRTPTARDERRITTALRQIEAQSDERLPLAELARDAGMSPYHFLRTFRQVVGTTPHQFVLRTRLQRAAARLRGSDASISTIAYAAGFDDLSAFNHRFRRVTGLTPRAFRTARPDLRRG